MMYQSAIIGFGGMGSWHYENISSKIPQINVKGIFDIRDQANQKAQELGVFVYPTLQALLEDHDIDLVTIAVPNNFHKDLSIQCMRAGKHVICEKPVTMDANELVEIIRVSEETGKLFSVHHNRRWDKDYVTIKKIISEDMIGKPYFIESRVQGSRRAMHGWRGYKVNGGGMVLDWGVHLLDQLMYMIDSPVVSVAAHLFNNFTEEVDDNIKIFIRFENGVSGLLEMSTNCFVNLPRWHVSCLDGTAVIEDWKCNGKMVQLNTDAVMEWSDDIVYTEAGPTRTMAPRPVQTTKEISLPEVTSDWSDYYNNIVDVLDQKAELIVKPEQVLRVMKVIDLIFKADNNGETTKCHI